MGKYIVKIESINQITHDVIKIVTEKPVGYNFIPGQATGVAINKPDWDKKKRPLTFTCLPDDNYLEFIIKIYPEHKGVTNEMLSLTEGDELVLGEVFGSISYQGEGVFIAGGSGITPFLSIIRDLHSKNKLVGNVLLFANKTKADIILQKEIDEMMGDHYINILSEENINGYYYGMVTEDFLKNNIKDFNQPFYVCGPPPMMKAVVKSLSDLHVDEKLIIKEAF
ncbi:MAG: hypothetical protein WCR36_04970 [Bacteroidaceae bacterium]